MYATTDELIAAVRRKGRIPDSVPDYTDAVILAEADDVISTYLVPILSSLRQGFLLGSLDVTLTAGTARYTLPESAAGDAIEMVTLIDSAGVEHALSRYDVTEFAGQNTNNADPYGFTVDGDAIVLFPTPDAAKPTMRVRYARRRSKLVPLTSCVEITAVAPISLQVTGQTKPTGFAAGAFMDVVRPDAPFPSPIINKELNTASVAPAPYNFIFVNGTDTSGAAVGDYLCLAGETCVLHMPVELHAPIADLTASAILSQMGDAEGSAQAQSRGVAGVEAFKILAGNRVKQHQVSLVNHRSLLRMRGYSRFGGRFYGG